MSNFYLIQRFGVVQTDNQDSVLAKARELLTVVKSYLQNIHANGFSLLGFSLVEGAQFRVLLTTFISIIERLTQNGHFRTTTQLPTGTSPGHVLEDLNTNLRELDEYLTRIRQLDNVMDSIPGWRRVLNETFQASARSTTQLPTGTPVPGLTSPDQDPTTAHPPVGTNTDSHMDRLTETYPLENNAYTNIWPENPYAVISGGKRRKTRGRRSRKTRGRRSRKTRGRRSRMNRNKK